MDYNEILNDNFSLENYNEFFKNIGSINKLPIIEQRKLKEALSNVLEQKLASRNKDEQEFEKLSYKYNSLKNELNDFIEYSKKGYDVKNALDQVNDKITKSDFELNNLQKKLKEEIMIINLIESTLKANKFSEQQKKVSDAKEVVSQKATEIKETVSKKSTDFKIMVKNTPQKICSANISLLGKLRKKGREKYSSLVEKFNKKFEASEQTMQNLEQEENEIKQENKNATAFERYSNPDRINVEKKMKKEARKIKMYAKQANVLAKLRNGIVRSFDVNVDFYNKMSGKLQPKSIAM